MIKRISKSNDMADIIMSYPTGIIDYIHTIKYYILGDENRVITSSFERQGDAIKVILPSSELLKLKDGVLYRKAYYTVTDSSYPDGKYDLEICDNMNVWLMGETGHSQDYITADDLKTINGVSIVGVGDIVIPAPEGCATQEWVESQGYLKEDVVLTAYAKKSWVESKGYLTEVPSDYAKKTDIPSLSGYATQQWVNSQGYLKEDVVLTDYAKKSWVEEKGYVTNTEISGEYAKKTDIPSLSGYATEQWVENKNYLTEHQDISGKLDKTSIWTGTETEWNSLTDAQKSSYMIALIR